MKQYLQRLDQRLPLPRVVLLPGDLFYCHSFEVPEGTPEGEVGSFARLQLETAAPFPIESLAWGFVRHGHSRVLVYAATFDRLTASGAEDLGGAWHVQPAFVAVCGQPVDVSTVRFAATDRAISALFFNAGESVPYRVVSRPLPALAEGTETHPTDDLLKARAALLPALGRDMPPAEAGLWRVLGAAVPGRERVQYEVERVAGDGSTDSPSTRFSMGGQAVWDSDVRGREFAGATQKQRRQSEYVWLGFAAACAAVALLLLGQVGLLGLRLWTRHVQHVNQARTAQVNLLESKMNFADNLESITQRELKPFSMLAAAAAVKPAEVFYERISTTDWNVLRLDGQAGRQDQVAAYIKRLQSADAVQEVRNVRTESRGGRTSFNLEVVFKPLADLTPLTPKTEGDADAKEAGASDTNPQPQRPPRIAGAPQPPPATEGPSTNADGQPLPR